MAREAATFRTLKAGGVAAALALAAACASSTIPAKATDHGSPTATADAPASVAQALNSIPDTGWDEDFIAFGATARMTAIDGSAQPGTYSMYYALADQLIDLPGPQGEAQQLAVLGFDPQKAAFSVTVTGGTRTQSSATMLFGSFDTATIGTTLATTGLTRTGSGPGATTWTYNTPSGNALEFPMTADNDTVPGTIDVSPSRLVFSPTASPVTALSTPTTEPLSRNPMADALANCLGPAITGIIGRIYQQSDTPGPTPGALGITPGPGNATSVEVCVAAGNPSTAQAMETRWTTGIRSGRDSSDNLAWSAFLTNPQATTANQNSGVVHLSAEIAPGDDPAHILDEYLGGPISSLILPPTS